jgi:hypothetical protein
MYSINITISEFSNRNAIYKTRYIRTKLKNLKSICNAVDNGMFKNDMFYNTVISDVFKQLLYEDSINKSFSITLMYSTMKTTSMILFITAVKQTNDEIIAVI